MKNRIIIYAFILVSVSMLDACSSRHSFYIVKNKQAASEIVIDSNASQAEKYAAGLLQKYVQRISGVKLPINKDIKTENSNAIVVGKKCVSYIAENKSALLDKIGKEGFVIRTQGHKLLLFGGGDWGTVYSAYTLLEKLGCRWFMPGPLGEVIPHNNSVKIDDINDTEKPSFKYRHIGNGTWSLANKSNNFLDINELKGYDQRFSAQNYAMLVPSNKYMKKHPEYYAVHNGVRTDKQLNLTNKNVVNIIAGAVENFFKDHPGPEYPVYSVTPNDNSIWSNTEADRRFGKTVSDQVMRFTNEVAKIVGEKYPNKLIDVLAYQDYVWAPESVKRMEPNVAITFCRIDTDGVYSYPLTSDNHYSKRIRKILNEWLPKADHFLFYDYYAHYSWFGPWPLEKTISEDYKYYRSLGPKVEGLVPEFHPHWGTQGINDYVMAKVSWDVNLNVDSLVDDYYNKFYEKAAGEVGAYFNLFDKKIKSLNVPFYGQTSLWNTVYTPEVLKKANNHLNKALELAGADTLLRERIKLLKDGLHCVELKALFQIDRNNGDMAAAYRHGSELINLIKSFPVNSVFETGQILHEATKSLGYIQSDIAKFSKVGLQVNPNDTTGNIVMIKNWYVIGPFPDTLNMGWDTQYPPEKEINLDAAYKGKFSEAVGWKLLKSSRNLVDLKTFYPDVNFADAYAVSYVYSPVAKNCYLALGSDDGNKAWVNNNPVGSDNEHRTADAFQDMYPIKLKIGWNKILLKITQGAGGWGFYCSILDKNAHSLSNLKYSNIIHE